MTIIEIIYKNEKLEILVKIVKNNFRSVTKSANFGLKTEYIIRNDKLGIIGRGSKEGLAIENFKEEVCKIMDLGGEKI